MSQFISSTQLFMDEIEFHYQETNRTDHSIYPHYHDFYEIIYIKEGTLHIEAEDECYVLPKGTMMLLYPYKEHTKIQSDTCCHINLAFPIDSMKALEDYLCIQSKDSIASNITKPLMVSIPRQKRPILIDEFDLLNYISTDQKENKKKYMRQLLHNIYTNFLHPVQLHLIKDNYVQIPIWFSNMLLNLNKIDNLCEGMDYILNETGKSKEYIYRCFRKYLGTTPSSYINTCRLEYIANMLIHSDIPILELQYQVGFNSTSQFYKLFRSKYFSSPLEYRKKYTSKFF